MKLECDRNEHAEREALRVVASLIDELDRAVSLINSLDDICYCRRTTNSSSVGAQFRHNLDLINAFLKGVGIGRIDYSDRRRDLKTENNRNLATSKICVLKTTIGDLDLRSTSSSILVRSEIESDLWFSSSVLRELEFVHSHTVHHHALIAEKLLGFGIQVEKDFGVALSTLRYWKEQAA